MGIVKTRVQKRYARALTHAPRDNGVVHLHRAAVQTTDDDFLRVSLVFVAREKKKKTTEETFPTSDSLSTRLGARIPGVRGGILDEAKRPSVERVPEDPRFRNERVRALEPTRSVYQVAILRRLCAQ